MKIDIRHLKEKDLFELQIVEPSLRAHFLLNRKALNEIRVLIEKTLCDTGAKK